MLGHASSVFLNTLLCHHLSDCCRLCCQCCHKGRAANPGAEQLPGAHSRGSCAAAPRGQLAGQPSGGCRDRLSERARCPGCAASAELLWLHQHRGTGRRSFAVAGGRGGQGGLELQPRAHPPKISVGPLPTETVPVDVAALLQRQGCKGTRHVLCFTC